MSYNNFNFNLKALKRLRVDVGEELSEELRCYQVHRSEWFTDLDYADDVAVLAEMLETLVLCVENNGPRDA